MEYRFKIGEKCVALNNQPDRFSQPRVKGQIYTVKGISYCMKCGNQFINLGYKVEYGTLLGCDCGSNQPNNGLHWTYSQNFSPLTEEALEKAIENENYELAAVLRDALQKKLEAHE